MFNRAQHYGFFLVSKTIGFGIEVFYNFMYNWVTKAGAAHTMSQFVTSLSLNLSTSGDDAFASNEHFSEFLFAVIGILSPKFRECGCSGCNGR